MNFNVRQGGEGTESELPALKQLVAMGYEYKNQAEINKMRKKYSRVILYDVLEDAIRRLNPELDETGIKSARSQLDEDNYPDNLPVVDTNEKIRAKLISLSRSGGLNPVVVTQTTEDGTVSKTVKIFDFENIDNNDFIITNQFKIQGHKTAIFPDIVVFVNGIPLVVIECKDPGIIDPIGQAYDKNLSHYQKQGQGFEKLFFYNHCIIAMCGFKAKVGTICADINHYARWADVYPLEEEEVENKCGRPVRDQERIIAGLLSKENLLNHLKYFVIYETVNGKKIKKIGRYQQFRVVEKSFTRLQSSEEIKDKGGVIWHTQGSGKSLSMLWFALQLMYRYGNPPIIIITDRKQLDMQVYTTFKECGFPTPVRAEKKTHLAELLSNPRGKTIMTTIDKFVMDGGSQTDEKVICLVDEAHRSHFKFKAAQMREAMPNAVFFGFTGTPIDKKNRNDFKVFGPLIDKYGFKESQADGATLPIKYEGRMAELSVEGSDTIEQIFERIIGQDSAITPEMKESLKKQCITKEKIAEAPSRIKRIALDIVEHYTKHIEPNEYKAMIATSSREAAVLYKKELDRLNAPASKIIMTSSIGETGKDDQVWDEYYLSPAQCEREAEEFKKSEDPTKILIVVDMLLVGYDVPICQVLYLDKGLREHNLLQAVARVNRPYNEPKKYGLVVDYFGITRELQNALDIFEKKDVNDALLPIEGLHDELKEQHRIVMKHFEGLNLEDYDAIVVRFEPEDHREKFEHDFKKFSSLLDVIMPDPAANQYVEDFKLVSKARLVLHTAYNGEKPNTRSYAKKIQQLIDDHVRSSTVRLLVERMLVSPENFLANLLENIKSPRAKAALIKARATAIINEFMPNNPAFYEKLHERLQRLIDEEEKRRKENAEYFMDPERYAEIYNEAISEEKARNEAFGDYKATQFEFGLYCELNKITEEEPSADLAKEIFSKIGDEVALIGWKEKPSVIKKIHAIIYDVLKDASFSKDEIKKLSEKIVRLAVNNI